MTATDQEIYESALQEFAIDAPTDRKAERMYTIAEQITAGAADTGTISELMDEAMQYGFYCGFVAGKSDLVLGRVKDFVRELEERVLDLQDRLEEQLEDI